MEQDERGLYLNEDTERPKSQVDGACRFSGESSQEAENFLKKLSSEWMKKAVLVVKNIQRTVTFATSETEKFHRSEERRTNEGHSQKQTSSSSYI